MFSLSLVLAVESMCLASVLVLALSAHSIFWFSGSGINPQIVLSQPRQMNKLSSAQNTNASTVKLKLSNVSTGPIRAITKYLNINYC